MIMDENRNNMNNTDLTLDTEAILRKRKEGQPAPQRPAPSQMQRRPAPQNPASVRRPAPDGQPRPAQRREGQAAQRPQGVAPQRRVPPNCPMRGAAGQPPQGGQPRPRPAQPNAARPAGSDEGAVRRPAPRPRPVQEKPKDEALHVKATPVATFQESAPAPSPAPAPAPEQPVSTPKAAPVPSYQQRRIAATHAKATPEAQSTVVASKANDAGKENSQKKKKEKPQVTDKQKNAKAGADMMVGIVKAMAYMAVILVVSVFISIFVIRIGNDVFAFVKSDEAVDVTIPENADIGDIADILSDNGIINFPGIFKMYAGIKKVRYDDDIIEEFDDLEYYNWTIEY